MSNRRHSLKVLAAAAAASMAPAIVRSQPKRTLNVSWWGFGGPVLQKFLVDPFKEKYNCDVVIDTGGISDRYNRLRLRPGSVDVVYFSELVTMRAIEAGLLEPVDRKLIPNIADLYPGARAPSGEKWGPGFTIQRYGIIYDATKVSPPIRKWADIWRPDLKNRISIPGIASGALGFLTIVVAGNRVGVDAFANPDAAFKSLAELKPNVVKTTTTGSEIVNLFSQGEIIASATQDYTLVTIKKAVPGVVWANLEDGEFANFNTINIGKGSKNLDLAAAFINMHLDPDVQAKIAAAGIDAPVNQKAVLTPEQAAPWAYGAATIAKLRPTDTVKISAVAPAWVDRWNELFAT